MLAVCDTVIAVSFQRLAKDQITSNARQLLPKLHETEICVYMYFRYSV